MHKNIIILAILFFLVVGPASSQEKPNTLAVDTQSFVYYQNNDWKALIKLAKRSMDAGIDFYYLRYRVGIAYYELKNYRAAIPHFQKVLDQNPGDTTAQEYLYYAYLLGGRPADAKVLATFFSPELKQKLGLPTTPSAIDGLGLEYKLYLFDDYSAFQRPQDQVFQKVRNKLNYFNLNLSHPSGKRMVFFHALSLLTGNNTIYDPSLSFTGLSEDLRQWQYYLQGHYQFDNGISATAAIHYVHSKNYGDQLVGGPGQPPQREVFEYVTQGVAGLLKINKHIGQVNFKLSTTVSWLNEELQVLPLAGIDYYPFGNNRFYLTTEGAYQFAPDVQYVNPGWVFRQKIGIGISRSLWLEPFFQYGSVSNYADEDAYVIYNIPDAMNYWYGAKANWYLFDYHLNLYYIFQYYQMTNYYQQAGIPLETDYFLSSHLLGLRWKL